MARSAHAACCLNFGEEHPQLLITGGRDGNDNTLSDAWILDVTFRKWREVSDEADDMNQCLVLTF